MENIVVTRWLWAELAIMAVSLLLWARDLQTLLILLLMGGTYALGLLLPDNLLLSWGFRLVGIYVLMNAIKAPLALIDGKHVGDGADLQRIYLVLPEIFWVLLWFAFALAVLGLCMYVTL